MLQLSSCFPFAFFVPTVLRVVMTYQSGTLAGTGANMLGMSNMFRGVFGPIAGAGIGVGWPAIDAKSVLVLPGFGGGP